MKFNIFANKREPEIIHSTNKVIVYQSELDYLSKCILESPNMETGGNLFGLWTPFGIPMIHYVVGPGPNAIHHVTHFRQDFNFLERNADCLVDEHALHHIGSWHSHHSLGLTQPSQGDSISTLEGMKECRLKSFLLIIGNCRNGHSSVRPYRYHADGRCELLKWVVLPDASPIRPVYDKRHSPIVYRPSGTAVMEPLDTCDLIDNKPSAPAAITYPPGYWLNEPNNKKEFASIIQHLKATSDNVKMYQKEDQTIEIQLINGSNVIKLHLNSNFPQSAPLLYAIKGVKAKMRSDYTWRYQNSIKESFVEFINAIEYDT